MKTTNLLKSAITRSKTAFIIVGAFSLFINLAMLITPVYMLQIYDRVLTSGSIDTLLMLTILAACLLALNMLVEIARSQILIRISTRLNKDLTRPIFIESLRAKLGNTATSVNQPLDDLSTLRNFLTGAGLIALFDAPFVPLYLGLIFLFDPLLGSIALGGAIIILALAIFGEYIARPPLQNAGKSSRTASAFLEQISSNVEAIHAMGMVSSLTDKWSVEQTRAVHGQANASDRIAALNAVAKMIRMGLQIAILGTGAWLSINQIISPGVMIAASIIMGRALSPVQAAIGNWRQFIETKSAFTRLTIATEQMRQASSNTKLQVPNGHLSFDGAYYQPETANEAILKNISFELHPGTVLGLIGRSGSGKTSLARLAIGLYPPTIGSVKLDGANFTIWPRPDIAPYLGYLPQNVELLAGTIAENICRFGEKDDAEIISAATRVGAHEMILNLPGGYDTQIGAGACNLSSGQSQLIGLARAVYKIPRLIILDEPNSNLDSQGDSALRTAIDWLKSEQCTLIIISHKPSILTSVDQIMVLDQGAVDLFGERDEVIAKLTRPVKSEPTNKIEKPQAPAKIEQQSTG